MSDTLGEASLRIEQLLMHALEGWRSSLVPSPTVELVQEPVRPSRPLVALGRAEVARVGEQGLELTRTDSTVDDNRLFAAVSAFLGSNGRACDGEIGSKRVGQLGEDKPDDLGRERGEGAKAKAVYREGCWRRRRTNERTAVSGRGGPDRRRSVRRRTIDLDCTCTGGRDLEIPRCRRLMCI